MRRQLLFIHWSVLLVLVALCTQCSLFGTVRKNEIMPFEPEKHCDAEMMALAADMPREGELDAEDVTPVVDALSECGAYAHEVAEHNTGAAVTIADEKPGFAFGAGLGAGTVTVLAILKYIGIILGGLL